MSTISNHLPFSGEMEPTFTIYGPSVSFPTTNQLSQQQKTTTELASPVAHSALAAISLPSVEDSSNHSLLYRTYHYDGKNTNSTSPKILPASFTLPETLFQVPPRWHKVTLLRRVPLLMFAPSVQPPLEKFVPRPSRCPLIEYWKVGACEWQKQAKPVPALEYRDVGYSWRWPNLIDVFKWLRGGKRGR